MPRNRSTPPTSWRASRAWPVASRPDAVRLLVVDDNAEAAEVLGIGLELLGQEVRTALDGESALALVDEWRPDTAILDLSMPGMGGIELAQAIRARLGAGI